MGDFKGDLKKVIHGIEQFRDELPRHLAENAVQFAKSRFRAQGFRRDGDWPKRDPDPDPGRAILVKTGTLRRSIRIAKVTAKQIIIGSDVSYADAHNQGAHMKGTRSVGSYKRRYRKSKQYHNVKAHTRKVDYKLPKRQFLGPHPLLSKKMHETTRRLWKRRVKL